MARSDSNAHQKQCVILLRLVKPHFVQVIPTAKPLFLTPAHEFLERMASLPVNPRQRIDEPLKTYRRKNGLIHL